MRQILVPALAATVLLAGAAAIPTSAHAAACYYQGLNSFGELLQSRSVHVIDGVGRATKADKACVRARRECNRKLERAQRRGDFQSVSTSRGARCTRNRVS